MNPRFEIIIIENEPGGIQTAQMVKSNDLEDVLTQFKQVVKEIKKKYENPSRSDG